MRIAQVAPLFETVPPTAYGGTERVVSYLTETLVAMGHDVTLFASGDSKTAANLVPVVERSLRCDPRRPEWLVWHTVLLDQVFAQAPDFDVVHFHVDYLHYPLVRHCPTPCLTTLHGRLDLPDLAPLHHHFREQGLVSISNSQRRPLAESRWLATVPHGLPTDLYRFHPEPADYFAFVGRISPEKRVDRAIRIAQATGVKLRIAAKVDRADQQYFEREIAPLLDHPLVEFIGEIGEGEKDAFIGNGTCAALSDRLARALRTGDDRSDGLWHSCDRLALRLGAGSHRARDERIHRRRHGRGRRRRPAGRRTGSTSLPRYLRATVHGRSYG